MTIPIKISVQVESFDVSFEQSLLTRARINIGAVVAFTGLCRSDSGLKALELEHYPQMAEAQLLQLVEEASARWKLLGATIIHRVGIINVGEEIVLVLAASAHRKAAFEAASFMMDALKSTAPFWKKEHSADGSTGKWVEAKMSDEMELEQWDEVNE